MSLLDTLLDLFRGPQTPAPRPHPDPPAALAVRVSVWQDGNSVVPVAGVLVLDDGGATMLHAEIDGGRRLHFTLPPEVPYGWHAVLFVNSGDAAAQRFDVALAPDLDVDLPPRATPAPELEVGGRFFARRTPAGFLAPHTVIGLSSLRLFDRWLAGGRDAVRPVVDQAKALGFNQLRVWSMCQFLFPLDPALPHYYVQLHDFLAFVCYEQGLNVELTAFVDVNRPPAFGPAAQADHWQHLCAIVNFGGVLQSRVLLELVNENSISFNTIDAAAFSLPAGLLASRGSNGADTTPVTPAWSYGTFHPDRPADWPRKVGHNAMEWADQLRVPVVSNETCRPDQGRGPIPSDFFDAAANAALLCAGATFHCESGKQSLLLAGDDLACAQAWTDGALAVPLVFQTGIYTAPHLQGPPGFIFPIDWSEGDSSRAHARILGNRACVSLPQRRDGYLPLGVGGWRVTAQVGSVVLVER